MRKILFVGAQPIEAPTLFLDQEFRAIQMSLEKAVESGRVQLEALWATQIADLRRKMIDFAPHVLHLAGHAAQGCFLLQDENGDPCVIGVEEWSGFVQQFSSVECVVVMACETETLAQGLCEIVPYVIGMQLSVVDKAAPAFSAAFYDAIGREAAYDIAFGMARNAVGMHGVDNQMGPIIKFGKQQTNRPVETRQINKDGDSTPPRSIIASGRSIVIGGSADNSVFDISDNWVIDS